MFWFHCLGVSPWHIDCYLHAYEGRIWHVPTCVVIQYIMINDIHHLMIVCQSTEAIKAFYLGSSNILLILLKIIVSTFRFMDWGLQCYNYSYNDILFSKEQSSFSFKYLILNHKKATFKFNQILYHCSFTNIDLIEMQICSFHVSIVMWNKVWFDLF